MAREPERMVLVEFGPDGGPALFRAPREVVAAATADELHDAFERVERGRAGGAWIAGWLAYEAGYLFEEHLAPLAPRDPGAPLFLFGIFDEAPVDGAAELARMDVRGEEARLTPPEPLIARADYDRAFARVQEHITQGDCHQVNLTFPMRATLVAGDAVALWGALHRGGGAAHGAFVTLGHDPVVLSQSPELFFSLTQDGIIRSRPMKGTRPRDADPRRDAALARDLATSAKDRTENLMVVDLLRGDIARITRPGSVRVPALFSVEQHATVHQMTSIIEGRLAGRATLSSLMRALFPCGSVTGAPRLRVMEIIHEIEPMPRGIYCGAIGWMAPDGRAEFSVAIRTLSLTGREVTLNVGGGITHDSTPDGEWEEALWKARFVKKVPGAGDCREMPRPGSS